MQWYEFNLDLIYLAYIIFFLKIIIKIDHYITNLKLARKLVSKVWVEMKFSNVKEMRLMLKSSSSSIY